MPSTKDKDKKDKIPETGKAQRDDQSADDWGRNKENRQQNEGTPRDKSREQTAGTGRKTE